MRSCLPRFGIPLQVEACTFCQKRVTVTCPHSESSSWANELVFGCAGLFMASFPPAWGIPHLVTIGIDQELMSFRAPGDHRSQTLWFSVVSGQCNFASTKVGPSGGGASFFYENWLPLIFLPCESSLILNVFVSKGSK